MDCRCGHSYILTVILRRRKIKLWKITPRAFFICQKMVLYIISKKRWKKYENTKYQRNVTWRRNVKVF